MPVFALKIVCQYMIKDYHGYMRVVNVAYFKKKVVVVLDGKGGGGAD